MRVFLRLWSELIILFCLITFSRIHQKPLCSAIIIVVIIIIPSYNIYYILFIERERNYIVPIIIIVMHFPFNV